MTNLQLQIGAVLKYKLTYSIINLLTTGNTREPLNLCKEGCMSVMLVGEIEKLEKHYIKEARKYGIALTVFNKYKKNLMTKVKSYDTVVIFTNMVSHQLREEVIKGTRDKKIPFFMYHSCGVCTLRNCFNCLTKPD